MKLKKLPLLLTAIITFSSSAMIIRHDTDSKQYLVNEKDHPAIFPVQITGNMKECVATLISPTWAITAAHCTMLINLDNKSRPHTVQIAQQGYQIKNVIIHPDFGEMKVKRNAAGQIIDVSMKLKDNSIDVALLELSKPVTHVKPIPLYQTSDEVQQNILMLGWGDFARGDKGTMREQPVNDGQFRRAYNQVDGIEGDYLTFLFDHPSSDKALALEGVNGPGDSGGPALIRKNGENFLAGISSHGSYPDDMEAPEAEGQYGWREYYVRVSSFKNWINDSISGVKK